MSVYAVFFTILAVLALICLFMALNTGNATKAFIDFTDYAFQMFFACNFLSLISMILSNPVTFGIITLSATAVINAFIFNAVMAIALTLLRFYGDMNFRSSKYVPSFAK